MMEESLGSGGDSAWRTLHGPFIPPKTYEEVPKFGGDEEDDYYDEEQEEIKET